MSKKKKNEKSKGYGERERALLCLKCLSKVSVLGKMDITRVLMQGIVISLRSSYTTKWICYLQRNFFNGYKSRWKN